MPGSDAVRCVGDGSLEDNPVVTAKLSTPGDDIDREDPESYIPHWLRAAIQGEPVSSSRKDRSATKPTTGEPRRKPSPE
jgi:hypothetical protein